MWLAGRAGDTRQPCPVLSHERCSTHDRDTETASVSCRSVAEYMLFDVILYSYGGYGATQVSENLPQDLHRHCGHTSTTKVVVLVVVVNSFHKATVRPTKTLG